MNLTVLPQQAEGTIPDGSTILAGALQSGIAYPHSCRVGRCGSCKSRLLAGEIEHLPSSRFTLTDDEKTAGYFLACRARAKSDVMVSWLMQEAAAHDPRPFAANVVEVGPLTRDIVRLELALAAPLPYQAGQFVRLRIGTCAPRSYSMANMPGEARLVFYIRRTAAGCASNLAAALRPGEVVEGEGPFGAAFLRGAHSGPIIAVAGGSGLAPMQAVVEEALAAGMRQPIHLYFGARTANDLMLVEHFREVETNFTNFRFVTAVESAIGAAHTGRIGAAIAADWPKFSGNWQAYLAGPPPMVDSVSALLKTRGIAPANVFADPFYSVPAGEVEANL